MTRSNRRLALAAAAIVLLAGCTTPPAEPAPTNHPTTTNPTVTSSPTPKDPGFAALEQEFGARLGVFALDTGSGRTLEHRADGRFAFASTYKALAAAAVLDSGADLDRVVTYSAADLVAYSPVTGNHVGTGMTLGDLAEAAITVSDNTAGNLLLDELGGPAGFERDLRALGDDVTQADREEPGVNDVRPGDDRDTTSPRAFGRDLQAYALGDALDPDDRAQLVEWLQRTTTGDDQIRAGVPAGWVVGHKTGHAGVYGNQNDVAVLWPADGRAPWVLVVFSDRPEPDAESDDALIARAAGLVVTGWN
ncbi:class A beta-lactamase [Kineococcus sp. GCM10028916]|uniref:class A beta-lactamase n=1 Tax=Kineococcus sp. GCM10028916 TaxID=3273394 RepID=UPI0036297AE1